MNIRGTIYRAVMKLSHRFNWHYAPPIYPDGDTMLVCHWCGMRDVIKRGPKMISCGPSELKAPMDSRLQQSRSTHKQNV